MEKNVIVVRFDEPSKAYQAPTTAVDEAFRTAQAVFGETLGGDRSDGSPRSG